jgi:hypothetical protein
MTHHFLHWFFKWFFTIGAGWAFVNMCRQIAIPLAPRTIVRGGRRIRKGTVDNVLDGVGAIYGLIFFAAIAVMLWLP